MFDFAPLIPSVKNTYTYANESTYYDMYASSKFCLTMKKEGWDCLRHYEIIAAGCVPYFLSIDKMPNDVMGSFPKALVREAMSLPGMPSASQVRESLQRGEVPIINHQAFDQSKYWELRGEIIEWAQDRSLTKQLGAQVVPPRPPRHVLVHVSDGLPSFYGYQTMMLIIGWLESGHTVEVAANGSIESVPEWLFSDYGGQTSQLYGKGFSYTRTVSPARRFSATRQPADAYVIFADGNLPFPTPLRASSELLSKHVQVYSVNGNDLCCNRLATPSIVSKSFIREPQRGR